MRQNSAARTGACRAATHPLIQQTSVGVGAASCFSSVVLMRQSSLLATVGLNSHSYRLTLKGWAIRQGSASWPDLVMAHRPFAGRCATQDTRRKMATRSRWGWRLPAVPATGLREPCQRIVAPLLKLDQSQRERTRTHAPGKHGCRACQTLATWSPAYNLFPAVVALHPTIHDCRTRPQPPNRAAVAHPSPASR
jgi:hypothetical protein